MPPGSGIVVLVVKKFTIEVIGVDARRIDRQRLLQVFLRFLVATEAHGGPRYLVIERAEASIRGTL